MWLMRLMWHAQPQPQLTISRSSCTATVSLRAVLRVYELLLVPVPVPRLGPRSPRMCPCWGRRASSSPYTTATHQISKRLPVTRDYPQVGRHAQPSPARPQPLAPDSPASASASVAVAVADFDPPPSTLPKALSVLVSVSSSGPGPPGPLNLAASLVEQLVRNMLRDPIMSVCVCILSVLSKLYLMAGLMAFLLSYLVPDICYCEV